MKFETLFYEELSWGEFKNRNFSSIVIAYRHSGESYTTGFFGFNILISRSVLHAGCLRSLFFNFFIFFFSFFSVLICFMINAFLHFISRQETR